MLQSGKSATMLPSIAASSSGHWNQEGSRRWHRATRPAAVEPHPGEDVAAEAFDERHALRLRALGPAPSTATRTLARRQAFENLLDHAEALLDLADADPDPRIDVAVLAHRHLEAQAVIGRIGERAPRIEAAARRRGRHGRRQPNRRASAVRAMPVRDGAVLQRGGVVVELDQRREGRADRCEEQREPHTAPSGARSAPTPPGTMQSIISR